MERKGLIEIDNIQTRELRNNEHFQLGDEFKDLVTETGSGMLKITEDFDLFGVLHKQESDTIQKVFKSDATEKRFQADKERDDVFRGLSSAIKSAKKHYLPELADAAVRLDILFKTYGNVARKPYNEETAAIHTLLGELNGKYANDVQLLGLNDWVIELEKKNNAFEALMKVRFSEIEQRTELKAKEVREEVDVVYHAMVKRINALMLIEPSPVYENFIRQWNSRLKVYNDLLSKRRGR